MTPRMLVAALKRQTDEHLAQRRAEDERAGQIAAAVYTAGGVKLKSGATKRWKPEDFFPWLAGEAGVTDPVELEERRISAAMQAWGGVYRQKGEARAD